MAKKTHLIQVRLTEFEYKIYKKKIKDYQRNFGIKLNVSEFVRLCLDNIDDPNFLMNVGYLSYSDVMESLLSKKTKYPRLKKCKK